ncbi:Hypp8127 [Branchiostoma lanceolatum]|uniref:Hypp8127 protein n=1 Tax=Branchiostoma lanceolatum TaxID=7740 RepID=A0A8J9Z7B8_BRALA|nr:Hypp8127 [Branchiostoma lanceolatum]
MDREKDGGKGDSVPAKTTKKYRTRSVNTKPWNTPAKDIQEFEVLSEDYTDSERTKVCNLKCRTSSDRIPLWINATKTHFDEELGKQTGYTFTWKDKNSQLSITDPTKSGDSSKILTIHFYKSGTILIHGKGSNWFAEAVFPKVKIAINSATSTSSCQSQDGGQIAEKLTVNEVGTIDNNLGTIETDTDADKSAMMASDIEPVQFTPAKSGATDETLEKENRAEYTTPKSVTSPTIRKMLGGLENIILSPFNKMRESAGKTKSREDKSQQTNRSPRRALLNDNSSPQAKKPDANSEVLYTTLVDEFNELKTLVFNNKVAMDKQGKQVADLQANVQNKTKKIEKQAKQIEDLKNELQHQREFSKDLSDRLSSKCECVPRSDERRLQRLYSEIVSNHENPGNIGTQLSTAPGGTQTPAALDTGTQASTAPGTQAPQGPVAPETRAPAAPGIQALAAPDTRVPAVPRTQDLTVLSTQVSADPSTQAPAAHRLQAPAAPRLQAPAAPRGPARIEKRQIRIFADSLWNDVDTNRMFNHKSSAIVKSSTLRKASENVNSSPDTTTELVIFHVASNDMDNTRLQTDSVNICVDDTHSLINNAKSSFPNATIAISQVLPRGRHMESTLNKNIASYNNTIEKLCLEDDKIFYIRHRLLAEDRSLYKADGIHITPDAGVRLLVADVKRTLRHHQQSITNTTGGRQHTNPSGQQTRPPRNTPRGNTVMYTHPDRYSAPRRFPQQNQPPFPWNPAPPAPQQWSHWNERPGPMRKDKRHALETMMNIMKDFLND